MHHVGGRFRFAGQLPKPSQSLAVNPLRAISYSQNILLNAPPLAAKPVVQVEICPHNSNWKSVAGEPSTELLITTT